MNTIVIGSDAKRTASKYIQIIVDHHSRYAWGRVTKTNTADATIHSLEIAIDESNPPKRLIVDNGTNYLSKKFRQFCTSHGIEIAYIS